MNEIRKKNGQILIIKIRMISLEQIKMFNIVKELRHNFQNLEKQIISFNNIFNLKNKNLK